MDPDKVDCVVLAACVLHNFLRRHSKSSYTFSNSFDQEMLHNGEIVPGEWRKETWTTAWLQQKCGRKCEIKLRKI